LLDGQARALVLAKLTQYTRGEELASQASFRLSLSGRRQKIIIFSIARFSLALQDDDPPLTILNDRTELYTL
jgi:hypothetical protein